MSPNTALPMGLSLSFVYIPAIPQRIAPRGKRENSQRKMLRMPKVRLALLSSFVGFDDGFMIMRLRE
jgi:hypothetical protein